MSLERTFRPLSLRSMRIMFYPAEASPPRIRWTRSMAAWTHCRTPTSCALIALRAVSGEAFRELAWMRYVKTRSAFKYAYEACFSTCRIRSNERHRQLWVKEQLIGCFILNLYNYGVAAKRLRSHLRKL